MSAIDWVVMLSTLLLIAAYGTWKTRRDHTRENYLRGGNSDRWWVVGFSVIATQLSAITFLSTPGQGYLDGLRFVQFYFGLPLAMIVVAAVFIPMYYKWKVYTAYEFIGKRFDDRVRLFTAILFLVQRSLAAGITIYAPSLILSKVMGLGIGWSFAISGLVIIYTTVGGAKAVSATQTQQMVVIFIGMFVALGLVIHYLGERMSFVESLKIAGALGRMNAITTGFDPNDRYTLWSGLIGGFFLQLAYFGTDQSQVGRYLSGKSVRDAKLGMLFTGLVKIPMQFIVLLTGVLVFVFYLFHAAPVHWNKANMEALAASPVAAEARSLEALHAVNVAEIEERSTELLSAFRFGEEHSITDARGALNSALERDATLRSDMRSLVVKAAPGNDPRDDDHIFISFILGNMPIGIIGLLMAVMFCASMSTTSAELNALATTTTVDVSRRDWSGQQQVRATQWATIAYGGVAMAFAGVATYFGNLIQAVNLIGSLFYGTILGVFLVAFFLKQVQARAVLIGALVSQASIFSLFILQRTGKITEIGFLWYNLIAPVVVITIAVVIQAAFPEKKKALVAGPS